MPRLYGFITIVAVIICLGAYLVHFVDIETVLYTGPAISVFGSIVFGFAIKHDHKQGVRLSVWMVGFTIFLTVLTASAEWGPQDAKVPFAFLGSVFVITCLVLSNRTFKHAPRCYEDWQCQHCGYPIYGLSTNQCPECGTEADAAMFALFRDKPQ